MVNRSVASASSFLVIIIMLGNVQHSLQQNYQIEVPYIIVENQNAGEPTQLNTIKYETVEEQMPLTQQNVKQGKTAGKVVLELIIAYPSLGQGDTIVLRNIGGQTVNLTGWIMQNGQGRILYDFGKTISQCQNMMFIYPMSSIQITRLSKDNLCGFVFGLSFQDDIAVYNDKNELVAEASWESSIQGSAIRLIDNRYIQLSETISVLEILKEIDEFSSFRWALTATGLDKFLTGESDPGYQLPSFPAPPSPTYNPQFPWWFGFAVDRQSLSPPPSPPPPPPPPPFGQVSEFGPYTVFAPTNQAFANFQMQLTGGQSQISLQRFLKLPEARDILLYHIYYGFYTTQNMYNNTDITSSLGPPLLITKDATQTEGFIALNDACVDKPTRGFPCQRQYEFGKCFDPYMVSIPESGWRGGFCQKTCQRCTCREQDGGVCSKIVVPDLRGRNGVVHGIDRLLFPPPIFNDEDDEEEDDEPPDQEEVDLKFYSQPDFGDAVVKKMQQQQRGL